MERHTGINRSSDCREMERHTGVNRSSAYKNRRRRRFPYVSHEPNAVTFFFQAEDHITSKLDIIESIKSMFVAVCFGRADGQSGTGAHWLLFQLQVTPPTHLSRFLKCATGQCSGHPNANPVTELPEAQLVDGQS
jgi:hypothetical protein